MSANSTSQPLSTPPLETVPNVPVTHPRFHGRIRTLAHTLWWLFFIVVVAMTLAAILPNLSSYTQACDQFDCQSVQLNRAQMQALVESGISPSDYAVYTVVFNVLDALVYLIVAFIIFWRRGDDGMAYFVSLTLLAFGVGTEFLEGLAVANPLLVLPIDFLQYVGSLLLMVFFYIFPNGRMVPAWARWLLVIWSIEQLIEYFARPYHFPWMIYLAGTSFYFFWGSAVLAQVYRYRRVSTRIEQRQTKWVVLGAAGMVLTFLLFSVPFLLAPNLRNNLFIVLTHQVFLYIALIVLPISVGIAILRSQLYNIDLLINRTLVYGSSTAILAGVLAVSSELTKRFFVGITGGASDLAPILGTLFVVALFDPIRKKIQNLVDQHVKYETGTLGAFGADLKKFVELNDPDTVAKRFLAESLHNFGTPSGAIYFGHSAHLQLAHVQGEWSGHAALAVPMEYGGAQIGLVALGPRTNQVAFDESDRKHLKEMSELVAHALTLSKKVSHAKPTAESSS